MLKGVLRVVSSVRGRCAALFALLVAFVVGSPAMAQTGPTFDTTTIVATITAVGAAAAVVGAAYAAMRIGVRAWKWLTGAA